MQKSTSVMTCAYRNKRTKQRHAVNHFRTAIILESSRCGGNAALQQSSAQRPRTIYTLNLKSNPVKMMNMLFLTSGSEEIHFLNKSEMLAGGSAIKFHSDNHPVS